MTKQALPALSEFLQRFAGAVVRTLRSPVADPSQTLLISAILIVAVGTLALATYTVFRSLTGRGRPALQVARRLRKRAWSRRGTLITLAIVLIAVLGLLSGFSWYLGRPSSCARCHTDRREVASWRRSPHSGVGCLACHQEPGAGGWAIQKLDYLRWAVAYFRHEYRKPFRISVANSACKKCHAGQLERVSINRGVRVRHQDFLEEGARCTDCHIAVAHGEVAAAPGVSAMDRCILCHDNRTARGACRVCHVADVVAAKRVKAEILRIDVPGVRNCRGCHKPATWATCIKCHGLEMPHPPGWKQTGHQRPGFVSKSLCKRCHPFDVSGLPTIGHGGNVMISKTKVFCNQCHSYPGPHGPEANWIRLHGLVADEKVRLTNENCVECHAAASAENLANCSQCHGSAAFCDLCHAGKK